MRRHLKWTAGLLTLLGAGVLAGVFLPASSANTATTHASKVTTITVTANEWSFKLSKKTVPVGNTSQPKGATPVQVTPSQPSPVPSAPAQVPAAPAQNSQKK